MRMPLHNYEGIYELDTDDYLVYNCNKNRALKCSKNGTSKYSVTLLKNGKEEKAYIHRLVAEMMIPNPDNKELVQFKDGDTSNWKPENLYWQSYRESYEQSSAMQKSKYADELKSAYTITNHENIFVGCYGRSDVANKLGRSKEAASGIIYRHSKIKDGPYKGCWVEKRQLLYHPILDDQGLEVK